MCDVLIQCLNKPKRGAHSRVDTGKETDKINASIKSFQIILGKA